MMSAADASAAGVTGVAVAGSDAHVEGTARPGNETATHCAPSKTLMDILGLQQG
jgi:hypothetical protein